MANKQYVHGSKLRIYKDGRYLGTLTGVSQNATLNVLEKQYIGEESPVNISTTKEFDGSFTRDATDEAWVEAILQSTTTTKSTASNYTDEPDTVKATVDNVTDEDIAFTTPNKTGLTVEYVNFNAKKVGSFAGGLDIEIWEGAAGTGTLKATLSCDAGDLPTSDNEFLTAHLDETAEVALTPNVAHTIRFTAGGAPTGSVELYGDSAQTEPWFAIGYELSVSETASYTIDVVIPKADGTELILRDTGITFTSNAISTSAGELVGETLSWKAKSREVL